MRRRLRWSVLGSTGGRVVALAMLLIAGATVGVNAEPAASGTLRYMMPPAPIPQVLEAPAPPQVVLAPDGETLALLSRPGLPPIAELAEPELRLAGLAVNPRNNGPARALAFDGITFRDLAPGSAEVDVALPSHARVVQPLWSPRGDRLAFLLLREETVELWTAAIANGNAARIVAGVNAGFPRPFEWLPDGSGLLVRLVPAARGAAPVPHGVPTAPLVRESAGLTMATATIQNLIAGAHDEALFAHYFSSQLAMVGLDGAPPQPIGAPGLIADVSLSPDGRYLLEHRLNRPFPHTVTASAFPTEILVTNLEGVVLRRIADRPTLASLAEIPSGPRAVQWRQDAPATLFWAQRADDDQAVRDALYQLAAPFADAPQALAQLEQQFQAIHWGRDHLALVTAASRTEAREYRYRLAPGRAGSWRLLQTRAYRGGAETGLPVTRTDSSGRERLRFSDDGGVLMRVGDGLARLDVTSGALTPVWRAAHGERLFAPLDGGRLLVWREDAGSSPNLYLLDPDREGATPRRLTNLVEPVPELGQIHTRRLAYRRSDGTRLNGTLHLPADYEPRRDGPLPVLVWAYPGARIADDDGAGRTDAGDTTRAGSGRPSGIDLLPFLLVTQRYALFEAAMPVIGTERSPAMDRYIPEIVANAQAAVDALVAEGVAERGRIAIGGHSFGAAMAASLLAHSDLFRTGIALSGAYNRTLTPFGFQATERRSFWEAPDTYLAMSPFVHADRIEEPLLLVHGADDSNTGTWPMQSERLFEAIRGNGGTVRYVLLPHEDHVYRARESLMHVMWELDRWLDLHLRQEPATESHRPHSPSNSR